MPRRVSQGLLRSSCRLENFQADPGWPLALGRNCEAVLRVQRPCEGGSSASLDNLLQAELLLQIRQDLDFVLFLVLAHICYGFYPRF